MHCFDEPNPQADSFSVVQKQHLFSLSQALTVPIAERAYKPGGKPKNMRHPGLILPPQLGTSQSLMQFNTTQSGTPARLREISDWVPKQAPRFVTHDCTAMSPAVQANFRSTFSAIWGSTTKSTKDDFTSEYKRRYTQDKMQYPGPKELRNFPRGSSRASYQRMMAPDFGAVQIASPVVVM